MTPKGIRKLVVTLATLACGTVLAGLGKLDLESAGFLAATAAAFAAGNVGEHFSRRKEE